MITREEIDNLCTLARIGATDQEKIALQNDLDQIIGYVGQIANVVIPDDLEPHYFVTNITRDDVHAYLPGTFTQDLLNLAPHRDGEYIRVQKVL